LPRCPTFLGECNDELMISEDSDLLVIRDRDARLREYCTNESMNRPRQLFSVKGTVCVLNPFYPSPISYVRIVANSALFLQQPQVYDQLPVSANGAIPDVHITAFVPTINSLLSAGRSDPPTRVLTPRKSVINVVTIILDDSCNKLRSLSSELVGSCGWPCLL